MLSQFVVSGHIVDIVHSDCCTSDIVWLQAALELLADAVGVFISHRLLVMEGQHGAERLFEVVTVCCERTHCGHSPQCFTATVAAAPRT